MLVVDCSVAAAWALADESGKWTQAARTSVERDGMVVPWLFWFEIRNILIVSERRGRIDLADVERFIREMPKLIADVDEEPDGSAVMTLARSHQLTVYDAAYLELASRRKLALCTLDEQLIAAAPKSGVNLWSP
ncbi:MAG: type II toxin-antitoxin system VapC family toxin [Tepidisphaeraceae bacterium]|jgi:predicted nucleic acid-binding protein